MIVAGTNQILETVLGVLEKSVVWVLVTVKAREDAKHSTFIMSVLIAGIGTTVSWRRSAYVGIIGPLGVFAADRHAPCCVLLLNAALPRATVLVVDMISAFAKLLVILVTTNW